MERKILRELILYHEQVYLQQKCSQSFSLLHPNQLIGFKLVDCFRLQFLQRFCSHAQTLADPAISFVDLLNCHQYLRLLLKTQVASNHHSFLVSCQPPQLHSSHPITHRIHKSADKLTTYPLLLRPAIPSQLQPLILEKIDKLPDDAEVEQFFFLHFGREEASQGSREFPGLVSKGVRVDSGEQRMEEVVFGVGKHADSIAILACEHFDVLASYIVIDKNKQVGSIGQHEAPEVVTQRRLPHCKDEGFIAVDHNNILEFILSYLPTFDELAASQKLVKFSNFGFKVIIDLLLEGKEVFLKEDFRHCPHLLNYLKDQGLFPTLSFSTQKNCSLSPSTFYMLHYLVVELLITFLLVLFAYCQAFFRQAPFRLSVILQLSSTYLLLPPHFDSLPHFSLRLRYLANFGENVDIGRKIIIAFLLRR